MIFGYPLLVWPGMAQCLAVHVPRCNVAATDSQEDVGFLQVHLEIVLKKECNVCIDWFFVAYFVCFLETLEWWSDGVGWCGMCHVLACLQDTFHSPFTSFFVWLGGTILPEHCSYLKDTGKSWPQQPRKAGLSRSPKTSAMMGTCCQLIQLWGVWSFCALACCTSALVNNNYTCLGGGLKDSLFSTLLGEIIEFDLTSILQPSWNIQIDVLHLGKLVSSVSHFELCVLVTWDFYVRAWAVAI